jgi:hypothetical protein
MMISETSISMALILVWFNSMNTRTSVNIASTLVKLNSTNRDIGSWGVYLSIVERDDVAVVEMMVRCHWQVAEERSGWRCYESAAGGDDVPVQPSANEPSWKLGAVAQRALPKNLIRPLLVQDHKDEGFGDLLSQSPVHADSRNGETTAAVQ